MTPHPLCSNEVAERIGLRNKNALEASTGPVVVTARRFEDSFDFEVLDDGKAIPSDVLTRIGDPFFTTKPTGRGMGLGVFLARAVTESLGGSLSIESLNGRGTRARLTVGATHE